ncbi:MAG: response regulator [Bacteroidales bacterium]|nr:response regulator [Bacteroidales bacterium]
MPTPKVKEKIVCNILIVDDKEVNVRLLDELIRSKIVNTLKAYNGKEAIKLAEENDLALIILDIQMPQMDGFEVLKRVRAIKQHKYTPVILISALIQNIDSIVKGIQFGAIDFLAKPYNTDVLLGKVKLFVQLYQNQKYSDILISELEVNQGRLKVSESKFRKISYTANDAIVVTDSDLNINFWNRAAKDTFGYGKFEAHTEKISDLIIGNKYVDEFLKLKNIVNHSESERYKTVELQGKNKFGLEFPIEVSVSTFETKSSALNYVFILRNIAHRKQIEREKLKSKELREANKTMREFMDNVSHELRTPMNAILGISKMLLKYNADNLTKKQCEGLNIITQSGNRLLDLINDLLDLSRLEARRVKVKNESFEIEKVLSLMKSTAINLIDTKKIKFKVKCSSRVPHTVYADQNKLIQVLTNLIGNAVKFTESGKISLCVHIIENKLFFEVVDSGIGIDKERINSIFSKFQQLDKVETKKFKGTGLGLYISKQLVEMMGGEIKAESEPGIGTIMQFYINLPEETMPSQDPGIESNLDFTNITLENFNTDTKLALIIDNSKDNIFIYKNTLIEKEYSCITCTNGKDGLLAIEDFIPDLIFLRVEIPGLHGTTIINKYKNSPLIQNFVAISAYKDDIEVVPKKIPSILEPLSATGIEKCLQNLNAISDKPEVEIAVIYENTSWLKGISKNRKGIQYFNNVSPDLLFIKLIRRKVNTLIIENFENNENGLALFMKLSRTGSISRFDKIVLHHESEAFKYIKERTDVYENVERLDKEKISSKLFI